MSNLLVEDLRGTELCLGLPGGGGGEAETTAKVTGKRGFSETVDLKLNLQQVQSGVDLMEKMKSPTKEKDPAKPPSK